MYIIISPSKTQKPQNSVFLKDKELLFPIEHKQILKKLTAISKSKLQKAMKLSDNLAEQVYRNIQNYNRLESSHAFMSFTGFVFMGLQKDKYEQKQFDYISSHIRILDAFYGILEPGTRIKPYRLDFQANIGLNLYRHWNVSPYFGNERIINLASKEYAKMLTSQNMIHIHFLQNKDNKLVNIATYSKQARGLFLHYMIENTITNIDDLKHFNIDGYLYQEAMTNENNLYFVR